MAGLSRVEQEVIGGLSHDAMLARTRAWSAVNSGTGNVAGLAQVAGMLADAFSVLPGELRLVEPSHAERIGVDGRVSDIANGRHLHLSVRPEAPIRMLFTGHMDTVYPPDHSFQTLADLDDGTLGGPGVADMKGGLSVMLGALETIEASGAPPKLGYDIVVNSDEETGSFSSAALLAEVAAGKVAALTYEPALADGTLAGARGGTGNFSIVVTGRSAHAGRNPEEGRNAVVAAAEIAVRLAAEGGPALAVNPAKIDGGGPNNVVPDSAVLRINFRPKAAAEIERARAAIDRITREVAAARDVGVHVHGSFNRPPKPIDPGAGKLFALVKDAGADLGLSIAWRDTGGVCDGNNIAACGVPVVDTMGVRGGAIHSPQEFMIPESLVERAALSAVTILRIAERGRP
ncbi:Carboxypeptidase G2 [Sphingomonas sp. EC-HK361]|uniref:hydrolase n=1 Tax=Sphingomonas sp. EC-HK361 TaxID=2038397 RepID=UPI0012514DC9|nr:hydrolase [Sphingomonas sp. EC-HK361]VVT08952.1 Carboxypeptidase G2 [Sphingomonas sp. EC-HK361]